jgi:hypothetical protein
MPDGLWPLRGLLMDLLLVLVALVATTHVLLSLLFEQL